MTKTLWTKDFIRITLATSLGAAGGIISGFALSFLVFDETGSTLASALVVAIQLLPGAVLPAVLTVGFVLLSFVTHLQQYRATYGLVYGEVKTTRLRLAERLRKLPLGYFGKRDLADLTETIMGDVNRMEHVWSHVLGYL